MKITAIQPQRLHPERMNIHVDGAFRFSLSGELVLSLPLRVGDEVDAARLAELETRDQGAKARDAALSLLAHRDRSAEELRRRLKRKGFDAETSDAAVGRLHQQGVVDDAAFAAALVRDRARHRPRGKRALAAELRQKGVDGETAEGAIEHALAREGTSELELARAAAARWRAKPGEEPRRARARLHAFLARRGFAGVFIRIVIDEVLG